MTVAAYRDRAFGRYPVFTPEIRERAGALFGDEPPADVLASLGLDPVQAVAVPAHDAIEQMVTEGEPVQSGGVWKQTWVLSDLPPPPVPQSVTMRQARIALSRAGVLKAAEDAIAAMPGQAGEEARIEWDYAAELRRDHPLVTGLGNTLGLDAAAVDDLFRSAASI